MTQKKEQKRIVEEHKLTGLVIQLISSHLKGLARGILKLARLERWNEPVPAECEPKSFAQLPTGPYADTRQKERGDLLLFVPRGLNSFIIDDLSGGYGYSHAAVDCGEVDVPTGKPVMIESTVGRTVERTFIDQYGPRHFARVHLAQVGVEPQSFCDCVKSKLGEPYDDIEALTWGQIDDPAKQVCSDLAAVCLPEEIREDIAKASRLHLLRHHAVSVHSRDSEHGVREFISPNGFAEYFGAPQGEDIKSPGQLVIPHTVTSTPVHAVTHAVHRNYWQFVIALAAVVLVGLVVRKNFTALQNGFRPSFPSAGGHR
jgi:hypothetical protein